MNETKLVRQVNDKFKLLEEKRQSQIMNVNNLFTKEVERVVMFKPLNYFQKQATKANKVNEKQGTKFSSSKKMQTKIKTNPFSSVNLTSKFEFSTIQDLEFNITKRQDQKNKEVNFANIKTMGNLNKTCKSTKYDILVEDSKSLFSFVNIADKILMRTFNSFSEIKGVKFHLNCEYVNRVKSSDICVLNISLPDYEIKQMIKNKLFNNSKNDCFNNNNSLNLKKNELEFINFKDNQFLNKTLDLFTVTRFCKFDEKGKKLNNNLNKVYSNRTGFGKVSILREDDLKLSEDYIPFPNVEKKENFLDFDFNFYDTCDGNYIFAKCEINRWIKNENKISELTPLVSKLDDLNFIYSESLNNIFTGINELQLDKITSTKNLVFRNKIFNCLSNISSKNTLNNFEYSKLDEISNISRSELIIRKSIRASTSSSKKRKFTEVEKEDKLTSSHILINLNSLMTKLDKKKISNLISNFNNLNIQPITIEDKDLIKIFSNIDIILNHKKGVIIINPELFEDEYNCKSFDTLSESINKSYLHYENIIIAFYENVSEKSNFHKTKKIIEEFLTKKFSDLLNRFNMKLTYINFRQIHELVDSIYTEQQSTNSESNISFLNPDLRKGKNRILKLYEKCHFLNIYEMISLTCHKGDSLLSLIQSLREKYTKKTIMQNKYEIVEIVGEGAFGIVMKCKNKDTGEFFAIKKFKDSEEEIVQKSMLRELKVLKKLKHDNIVTFKECFRRKGKLYLVFEYVEKNLLQLLEENPNGLEANLLRKVMYQLCKAITYIHANETLHRDIKPENILITEENIIKVCDFGFARGLPQKGGVLTDYVATRWYRAPELLLGCANYAKEVDIWALGCMMGELADGQPMFPGESELNCLVLIQRLLGNFPQSQVETFYSNPRYSLQKLENVTKPETLERKYLGKLNKQAIAFIKSLIKLDPRERLTGTDLIMHPYFDDIRNDDPEFSHLKREVTNNVNILNTGKITIKTSNRNNKFVSTKKDFYHSKSPPHEISQMQGSNINHGLNSITSNANNINHVNINLINSKQKENPKLKKFQFNSESHMTSTVSANFYKSGYKPTYNLEGREDIYNYDIGNNFEETTFKPTNDQNKKKKIGNLNIIEEESDKFKKMGETRFNRFKPDTGADYYEEEAHKDKGYYSPKNMNILHNPKRKGLKEESPEQKVFNNAMFLPQISSYRGFGDFLKKEKK